MASGPGGSPPAVDGPAACREDNKPEVGHPALPLT